MRFSRPGQRFRPYRSRRASSSFWSGVGARAQGGGPGGDVREPRRGLGRLHRRLEGTEHVQRVVEARDGLAVVGRAGSRRRDGRKARLRRFRLADHLVETRRVAVRERRRHLVRDSIRLAAHGPRLDAVDRVEVGRDGGALRLEPGAAPLAAGRSGRLARGGLRRASCPAADGAGAESRRVSGSSAAPAAAGVAGGGSASRATGATRSIFTRGAGTLPDPDSRPSTNASARRDTAATAHDSDQEAPVHADLLHGTSGPESGPRTEDTGPGFSRRSRSSPGPFRVSRPASDAP